MFNFRAALRAFLTLLAFAGLAIGVALIAASMIHPSLTTFAYGAITLIVALSITSGLSPDQ